MDILILVPATLLLLALVLLLAAWWVTRCKLPKPENPVVTEVVRQLDEDEGPD